MVSHTYAKAAGGQKILYKTSHMASDAVVKKLSKNAMTQNCVVGGLNVKKDRSEMFPMTEAGADLGVEG